MPAYKLNIPRIEELITQYAETNGLDSNMSRMCVILEGMKKNKFPYFKDIITLSGILGVSPDYITGVSDEAEYDNPNIVNLIKSAMNLSNDSLLYLSEKAAQLDFTENKLLNYEKAGVNVIVHSEDGNIISESMPEKFDTLLEAADIQVEYEVTDKIDKDENNAD